MQPGFRFSFVAAVVAVVLAGCGSDTQSPGTCDGGCFAPPPTLC